MYKFIYHFARDKANKNMQMEMAVDLWELLLAGKCKFLPLWIEFLQNEKKDQKAVPKDTWDMLYELIETTKGDLSSFVDDGTWPPIIDQFAAYFSTR
jgi:DCN1-like protein 1/2